MAKQVIVDGFDICKPPECKDETEVVILSINSSCNVNVVWTVYNNDNIPSNSEIQWSFNNDSFKNSSGNARGNKPWETDIKVGSNGVLYLRAKVIINNQSYFSKTHTFSVVDCSSSSSSAFDCLCDGCPDECCESRNYAEGGYDAQDNGIFYIQWNTFFVPDKLLVVTPPPDCVDDPNNCHYEASTILFETPCEGTFGPRCSCFVANRNQLPLGVIIDPNCEGTDNTWWEVYICGPEGYEFSAAGGNEGLCCQSSTSSTSSSSSSSLSSSSSSNSSTSSSSSDSSPSLNCPGYGTFFTPIGFPGSTFESNCVNCCGADYCDGTDWYDFYSYTYDGTAGPPTCLCCYTLRLPLGPDCGTIDISCPRDRP